MTADDFGLDVAVNEAVEEAHRRGVLTAAALMVGQEATEDAIRRARRLPTLAVGLHLALTNAHPVLPPRLLPHLVDATGEFSRSLLATSIVLCLPAARRELRREVEAQFAAFQATGLPLDHVSVHQHLQLHPLVLAELIHVGRSYGMEALRLPAEPRGTAALLGLREDPWEAVPRRLGVAWARRTLAQHGIRHTDRVFGLAATGHLLEERVLTLLAHLPPGTTEIYCHPAVRPTELLARRAPGYDGVGEYQALLSRRVREAIARAGILLSSYRTLTPNPER